MRFKKKAMDTKAADALRPLLYGDVGMDAWPPENDDRSDPWLAFVTARDAWRLGATQEAVASWKAIARTSGLESRHTLQAWFFLRSAGVQPEPDESTRVLGAVAEVSVGNSHDLLIAYSDLSARYLNHAGGAAIVDGEMRATITSQLSAWLGVAQQLSDVVGVWDGAGLPPLPRGHTRILMLTPGGFRFGQGPDDQLRADPAAAAYLQAATQLLVAITNLAT